MSEAPTERIRKAPARGPVKPKRERRFLFRPTSVGVLTAGVSMMVGFAALNTGNNLIYLLTSIMLSFLICSALIGIFSLRGLELSRSSPPEAFAGKQVRIALKIASRRKSANAYAVAVVDGAVSVRERLTGRTFAPRVEPGGTVAVSYAVTPPRRGEYRFGEAFLVSGFPFGLFSALRRFDLPGSMIVYPRLGRLSPELIRLGRSWGSEKITRSSRRLGSDEFYGIREYRPGDNPRHIHWRTSARISKTMLKEFERDEPLGYTIVLDSFADPSVEGALDRFETAVSLTATLIDEFSHHGARVFLIAAMREAAVLYNGDRSAISKEMLRKLALIEPAKQGDRERLREAIGEHAGASAHITAVMLSRQSPLNECLRPAQAHGVHVDVIDLSDPRVARGFEPNPPA